MTLEDLYMQIPDVTCVAGCTECCGPVPWCREEHELISAYLATKGEGLRQATSIHCPYIGPGGCDIYPVRPLMCRMYGTVPGMACPKGRRPETMLTDDDGRAMLSAYVEGLRGK